MARYMLAAHTATPRRCCIAADFRHADAADVFFFDATFLPLTRMIYAADVDTLR